MSLKLNQKTVLDLLDKYIKEESKVYKPQPAKRTQKVLERLKEDIYKLPTTSHSDVTGEMYGPLDGPMIELFRD